MDILIWQPEIDKAVRRFIRSRPADMEEDLRQEIYLTVLENEARIIEIAGIGKQEAQKFVYTLAKNKIIDIYRKNKHQISHDSLSDLNVVDQASVLSQGSPDATNYEGAVKHLTSNERLVIDLTVNQCRSQLEVAKLLNKSRWWVRQTRKKALGKLRLVLEK